MEKNHFEVYVAISSSAGGFEAVSELVQYLPKKLGVYYFIAQHFALNQRPILADLLNRNTKVKAVLVKPGMVFKRDILYIIPPEIEIVNQNNKPTAVLSTSKLHHPVPNADRLLEQISLIKNTKTIAVVLSGTGNDGTLGVEFIKKSGGMTIVQTPQEAAYSSMPQSIIDARLADYILYISEIALKIKEIVPDLVNGTYREQQSLYNEIARELNNFKQFNLEMYKDETVKRRIEKHMNTLGIENIQDYVDHIKDNNNALNELNNEMLIGVTEFFRVPEAYDVIRKKIKEKLLQKKEYSEFRIWIVACSSGEEAYSFAIIMNEICEEIKKTFYIKIFASDFDERALEKAKKACYSAATLSKITPKLLNKYFNKSVDGYKIIQKLREQIVFAHHNFLSDPPFINLDLISCRNVLIYLKSKVQDNILAIFHYALKEEGILFLGSSESITNSREIFSTINNKFKIFEKKENDFTQPFLMHNIRKNSKTIHTSKGNIMQKVYHPKEIEEHLKESLFDYLTSGSLVIDNQYNIIYKKGDIPYLNFSDGVVSLNIFDNLAQFLHYDTRNSIDKMFVSNMQETSKFIQSQNNAEIMFIQVVVKPLHIPNHKLLALIIFVEIEPKDLILHDTSLVNLSKDTLLSALSAQLAELREEAESISQELSLSKQNMDLLNEELQYSNEKLQSTVEELETSNEELQSSNEELKVSLDTIKEIQNKLSLIIESSMDGILGLDMNARHTFVNAKAAKMLGYSVEYLLGKESHQIWHHTKPDGSYYPESECPVNDVLQNGISGRGEDLFWKKDGSSFPVEFVRSPIIQDGEIIGAVISFHDISEKKRLHKKITKDADIIDELGTKYQRTFEHAQIGIAHVALDGSWIDANKYLCDCVGYSKTELLKLTFADITYPEDLELDLEYVDRLLSGEISTYNMEKRYIHKNGNLIWINLSVILLRDKLKQPLYFVSIIQDITQVKTLMLELEVQKNQFQTIFRFTPNPMMIFSEDGEVIMINKSFLDLTGYEESELKTIGQWNAITEGNENLLNNIDKIFEKNASANSGDVKVKTKDGEQLLWISSLAPLLNMHNAKRVIVFSAMDITDMHRKEELMLAQSRQAAMGDMIGMIAHQWRQPLTVISMLGNNIRADVALDIQIDNEKLTEIADSLDLQTTYLSHVIDDFRIFLKPAKEKEKISLCGIYEKLKNLIGKSLQNNDIDLIFVDKCDIEVKTFANELVQVFINLINNAKDAYKSREINNAKIEIITKSKKDSVVIDIKDYAGGIDPKIIKKLGEPYVSNKGNNGTGLGLYMSKTILEKHFNGTLSWKSSNGSSCFTIRLPLK